MSVPGSSPHSCLAWIPRAGFPRKMASFIRPGQRASGFSFLTLAAFRLFPRWLTGPSSTSGGLSNSVAGSHSASELCVLRAAGSVPGLVEVWHSRCQLKGHSSRMCAVRGSGSADVDGALHSQGLLMGSLAFPLRHREAGGLVSHSGGCPAPVPAECRLRPPGFLQASAGQSYC